MYLTRVIKIVIFNSNLIVGGGGLFVIMPNFRRLIILLCSIVKDIVNNLLRNRVCNVW
jgi:DNA-binding cell septation regulator SpoVG